jgi:hypothetical protein
MQPFASAGIAVMAMTNTNAALPRIALIKKLRPCHSNPCAAHRFLWVIDLPHHADSLLLIVSAWVAAARVFPTQRQSTGANLRQTRRSKQRVAMNRCEFPDIGRVGAHPTRCLWRPTRAVVVTLLGRGAGKLQTRKERLVARLAGPLADERAA